MCIRDSISSCVKFFPDERPAVEQLCRHPLFQMYKIEYSTMGNAANENVEDFSEWRKEMYEKVRCGDELGYEANNCLLYTSDAADEEDSVDLGGRRIIKKKNKL
eukprot:TRINITY_DN26384_c0_g1_i1.p1 TRINITY_DN26384_c0_g1~~TRINITY_DN26384_c0_g1_i1.p1  ORF type:complete len:104 (-),score=27.89 TRINITY_DN26384_c0_g1_i1:47-358(-)